MSQKKQRPVKGGALPENPSERDLAAFTGMSRRQIWQAKKLAEIPEEEFERLVESDNVPTVTQLLKVARQRAGSSPSKKSIINDTELVHELALAICEADCGAVTPNELSRCRDLSYVVLEFLRSKGVAA